MLLLGPGLLAFALAMVAYSLRTWRRNGVACDELLFLPGTAHADTTINDDSSNHGSASTSSRTLRRGNNTGVQQYTAVRTTSSGESNNAARGQVNSNQNLLEGDVAAGVGSWSQSRILGNTSREAGINETGNSVQRRSTLQQHHQPFNTEQIELSVLDEASGGRRNRLLSKDSTLSSINEFESNSWDDDPLSEEINFNDNNSHLSSDNLQDSFPTSSPNNISAIHINNTEMSSHDDPQSPGSNLTIRAIRSHVVEDIREGQAQITRFGSLFFFRNTTTNTQNAAYAPSGPMVVGAALDLSMPILFNFHLFISAWNHLGTTIAEKDPAKILPMCFLTALMVRMIVPLGRRRRFWSTIKCTATAPFNNSRLRDSYLGDVLTSLVRPLQDVAFSMGYYVCGLWGLITSKYTLTESSNMLESSWILHTVILPSCALLPLWWKFLQTLRECYDNSERWPYLGNAFKYLSAAVVIMYGMTHPEERGSATWMFVFFLNWVYQIWWDTVMDWELFVVVPKSEEAMDAANSWCTRISSINPTSRHLLTVQRYILNPFVEAMRQTIARIPSWRQFQIRPRRLYKTESFYWKIFFFNACFRFTWMLSFIPSYSLALSRRDAKEEFESDTDSYLGVLLPVAEIFRRTLWGLLYLEIQTIHMTDGDPNYRYACPSGNDGNDVDESNQDEDSAVSVGSNSTSSKRMLYRSSYVPSWLSNQLQIQDHATHGSPSAYFSKFVVQIAEYFDLSPSTIEALFVLELCAWAFAFVGLGLWATSQNQR
jgi:EXS family